MKKEPAQPPALIFLRFYFIRYYRRNLHLQFFKLRAAVRKGKIFFIHIFIPLYNTYKYILQLDNYRIIISYFS